MRECVRVYVLVMHASRLHFRDEIPRAFECHGARFGTTYPGQPGQPAGQLPPGHWVKGDVLRERGAVVVL